MFGCLSRKKAMKHTLVLRYAEAGIMCFLLMVSCVTLERCRVVNVK